MSLLNVHASVIANLALGHFSVHEEHTIFAVGVHCDLMYDPTEHPTEHNLQVISLVVEQFAVIYLPVGHSVLHFWQTVSCLGLHACAINDVV